MSDINMLLLIAQKKSENLKKYLNKFVLAIIMILSLNSFADDFEMQDCKLNFEKIGIKNFNLGISLSDLKKENPTLEFEFIQDDIELYDDYRFTEKAVINGIEKTITYYFNFKENKLLKYFFKLDGDREFFDKISKKLTSNTFIEYNPKKGKYNYYQRTETCYKYFRIKIENEKMKIIGGIESKCGL